MNTIGILGIGYLGKYLLNSLQNNECWGTFHQTEPLQLKSQKYSSFRFQWENSKTWNSIPLDAASLVLTIPPIFNDPNSEMRRLSEWGRWMNQNRPLLKKMIYISSTGVYPNQNGTWKEDDAFTPDKISGQLRLVTEETLKNYFELSVVRAGGIYGPERHIGLRVLKHKKIPIGKKPIHRIHVIDLANIIKFILESSLKTLCINAVDQEPKPSKDVVDWLYKNNLMDLQDLYNQIEQQNEGNFGLVEQSQNRIISNQKLLFDLNFKLQFPTYKEGFSYILKKTNSFSHDCDFKRNRAAFEERLPSLKR